jgi:glycosyltransferase involved in cell wall biosynthesis
MTPSPPAERGLSVLTWHVHGNYLWYLSAVPVTWYLPVRPGRPHGYGGRGESFTWPDNVVEVDADRVHDLAPDVVLYQSHRNWEEDRYELLDERLRRLPSVVLEHDPPRRSPTDERHPAAGSDATIVHVTDYNRLMWDCGPNRSVTISHGVRPSTGPPAGDTAPRGVVVVNDLATRGRRLGADLVDAVREHVPLDVVGMGSERLGGLGEIPPTRLRAALRRYRFFFHPARYTSLGLAVCEAMHEGLPIVGLPTTELPSVVVDGREGFLCADVETLVTRMRLLIDHPELATTMGANARRTALDRYSIDRFVVDWSALLREVAGRGAGAAAGARTAP